MSVSFRILALSGLAILFAAPAQAQNASPDLTQYCRDTMGGNMTGGWSKRKKGWYCFINGRDDQFSRALVLDEACRKQFPNSTGGAARTPGAGLDPVPSCKGTSTADRPRSGASVAGGKSPDLGAWCRSKNPKATDAVFKGNTWHCIFGRYVPGQGFGADAAAACASQFPGSRPVKSGQDSQGRTRWLCKTDGVPASSAAAGGAARAKGSCTMKGKPFNPSRTTLANMTRFRLLCRSGQPFKAPLTASQIRTNRETCANIDAYLKCRGRP